MLGSLVFKNSFNCVLILIFTVHLLKYYVRLRIVSLYPDPVPSISMFCFLCAFTVWQWNGMVQWYIVSLLIAFKGNDSYSQWNRRIDNFVFLRLYLCILCYIIRFASKWHNIFKWMPFMDCYCFKLNMFIRWYIIKSMKDDAKHCFYCSLFRWRLNGGNELSK